MQGKAQRRLNGRLIARLHCEDSGHRPRDAAQAACLRGLHHTFHAALKAVHAVLQLAQQDRAAARCLLGARARLLGGLRLVQQPFAAFQLEGKPCLDIFKTCDGCGCVRQKGVRVALLLFQPGNGLLRGGLLACLGGKARGGRLRRRLGGGGLHLQISRPCGKGRQLRFQLAAPFARGGAFFRQLCQRGLQPGNALRGGLYLGAKGRALGLMGGALGLQRLCALAACAQFAAQGIGRGLVVADVVFQHGDARVRPCGGLLQCADAGVLFVDARDKRLYPGADVRRGRLCNLNAPRHVCIVCICYLYFALRLAHGLFRAAHCVRPKRHFQPFAPLGQL